MPMSNVLKKPVLNGRDHVNILLPLHFSYYEYCCTNIFLWAFLTTMPISFSIISVFLFRNKYTFFNLWICIWCFPDTMSHWAWAWAMNTHPTLNRDPETCQWEKWCEIIARIRRNIKKYLILNLRPLHDQLENEKNKFSKTSTTQKRTRKEKKEEEKLQIPFSFVCFNLSYFVLCV